MFIEYGLILNEPGMEESYTIIPEDLRMNPKCPCPTRTCPNHGFCQYCIKHHDHINRQLEEKGIKGHPQYCKRS